MEKKKIIPLSLFLIACGGTDAAHPWWAVGVWAGSDSGSLLYRAGTHAITFDTLTIAADGTGQQHRTEVTNFPGSGVLAAARKALAAGESRTAVEAAVLKQTGLSLKQLEDGAAPVTSVTAGSFRWFVTVDTATNTAKAMRAAPAVT